MGPDEFTDDERSRESELTEPTDDELAILAAVTGEPGNACKVCGKAIPWPWDASSAIRCGRCGADNWQQAPLHAVDIPKLQATIRVREERR
jgi:hypothetical protein